MPGGDGFSASQRQRIDKAIRAAETSCRYEFSVYVGSSQGDPRDFAVRLHAALTAPSHSVLILLDRGSRALEVVTGTVVRRDLTDAEVRIAIVEMQAQFLHEDFAGGLVRGLQRLASYARKPPPLHV